MFVKSGKAVLTAAIAASSLPKDLDSTNQASIKAVAGSLAYETMTYYTGNATGGDPNNIGDLNDPYYWWEAGALWGAMLDYYHYTGDPTYNDVVIQALLAPVNTGTNNDYVNSFHSFEEGNDDLGFWGVAVLAAAERNLPQPDPTRPSWLELSENVFNSLVSRWNVSHCGGGLNWQIYASNPNGMNYKNSVSNGGLFQVAARLARATGNSTYLDWATKVWDWSESVGFIGSDYTVFDGTDSSTDCKTVNNVAFTYTTGIFLHGAAVMANYTGNQTWTDRATGLLAGAQHNFFSPFPNATNVMYENACELNGACDTDMKSFKGYLSRYMWQATQMVPTLTDTVKGLLNTSSLAAAKTCTGGTGGTTCGQLWYGDGFDGSVGLGQQMSALETVQGLLIDSAPAPLSGNQIQVVRDKPWGAPASTAAAQPTKRSNAAGAAEVDWRWVMLSVGAAAIVWGLAP